MNKLAVALGGGGARGLAHIGFLKVLDQNKIKVHAISGCSMGAIVGGLYAYFGSAEAVEDFVLRTINSEKYKELGIEKLSDKKHESYLEQFFDFIAVSIHFIKAINSTSYFDEELTNEIFDFIPDVEIESLKTKFYAVATDLYSGNEIIFSSGNLRKALQASASIPGIFPPVKYQEYFLVDGSVTDLVPVGILKKSGYEKIIAVDVVRSLKNPNPPKNILEILFRVESISSFQLSAIQLKDADILIKPTVNQYNWSDFKMASEIILEGELATVQNIQNIKKLVGKNIYSLRMNRLLKRIKGDE
jgi:NTE family protein